MKYYGKHRALFIENKRKIICLLNLEGSGYYLQHKSNSNKHLLSLHDFQFIKSFNNINYKFCIMKYAINAKLVKLNAPRNLFI